MEQEEDKKIGRPSLTVCMFCGLIFGLAVSAGWDNRGAGIGAGLLVGLLYYYVRRSMADAADGGRMLPTVTIDACKRLFPALLF